MGCNEIGAVSCPVTRGAGDPLTGVPIEEGTGRSARLQRATGFDIALTGPPSGGIGTLVIGVVIGPPDPAAGKSADWVGRLDDKLPNSRLRFPWSAATFAS